MKTEETVNFRTIVLGTGCTKKFYIRAEDVAQLIRDFGSTEETDVRNRTEELARRIERTLNVKPTA